MIDVLKYLKAGAVVPVDVQTTKVLVDALRQAVSELEQRSIAELESQEPVAHWSDCAVHSEPAYPKCECNCGGFNPLAWLVEDVDGSHLYWTYKQPIGKEKWTPLFSSPPQEQQSCDKRTWVGLTDEEENALIPDPDGSAEANVRRVEVLPGAWGKEYEEVDAWSKPLVLQMLRNHEAKLKEKNNA